MHRTLSFTILGAGVLAVASLAIGGIATGDSTNGPAALATPPEDTATITPVAAPSTATTVTPSPTAAARIQQAERQSEPATVAKPGPEPEGRLPALPCPVAPVADPQPDGEGSALERAPDRQSDPGPFAQEPERSARDEREVAAAEPSDPDGKDAAPAECTASKWLKPDRLPHRYKIKVVGPQEIPTRMLAEWIAIVRQESAPTTAILTLVYAESVTWPDGCIGAARPGTVCTRALVRGWLAMFLDGDCRQYRLHTGDNGAHAVRQN